MAGTHAERLVTERDRTVGHIESLRRSFDDIVAASEHVATDDEHDPEGHTIAWERQQAAALLAAAEARLRELELAMRRVDEGTYGRCEVCGRPIADDRLDALPTTATCVACAS
jgi:DnaK suppressor protein